MILVYIRYQIILKDNRKSKCRLHRLTHVGRQGSPLHRSLHSMKTTFFLLSMVCSLIFILSTVTRSPVRSFEATQKAY